MGLRFCIGPTAPKQLDSGQRCGVANMYEREISTKNLFLFFSGVE